MNTSNAQLWSENFNGANPYATVDTNTIDQSSIGSSGFNMWLINNVYTGTNPIPNTPNQPAGITGSPNSNYLHVSGRSTLVNQNAYNDVVSIAGTEAIFSSITTGANTTGLTGVTMDFWFLNASGAGSAEVYAKDGTAGTWTLLAPADFSQAINGVSTTWTQTTYSGSVLDNMANVILGFKSNVATTSSSPSFSIDDISITAPSTAVTASILSPAPIPSPVCAADNISFVADNSNPAVTVYAWWFDGANNGPQTLFGSTVNFTAINPGVQSIFNCYLAVTDGNTVDTLFFNLVVDPCTSPNINISGTPTTVCSGDNVQFTDATTPGSSPVTGVQWAFPGGTPATSTALNPLVSYNLTGNYDVYYQVTDGNGTYYDTLSNYITVINCPVPIADFQASATTICPGECIFFVDQSQNMGAGGSNWLWLFDGADSASSTQQNPQNICYNVPGTYAVTLVATNPNGSDTLLQQNYITVDSCLAPTVNFTVEQDSICQGTCIQFYNRTLRADSFAWTFSGADAAYQEFINVDNPIVCYSDTGFFTVQLVATNDYGADIYAEDIISVSPYPRVLASNDTSVYIGESVDLSAFGTSPLFQWTPDYELSCQFCREVTVSPKENTWYYVTNINDHGCASTDSVLVLVRKEYYSGVPDIFSPNGDGLNDELQVLGNGISEVEFVIFDRWGVQVFESRSQDLGWDGRYDGDFAEPGVYVYLAKVTYLNGYQELLQGDVTLVR